MSKRTQSMQSKGEKTVLISATNPDETSAAVYKDKQHTGLALSSHSVPSP